VSGFGGSDQIGGDAVRPTPGEQQSQQAQPEEEAGMGGGAKAAGISEGYQPPEQREPPAVEEDLPEEGEEGDVGAEDVPDGEVKSPEEAAQDDTVDDQENDVQ
jgi:hypothetical protein